MDHLCKYCEYGNRFTDLGKCPECDTGRIVGDFHTKAIFCSNLHRTTTVGIDFCGKRNCDEHIVFKNYNIFIISDLSAEQLANVGKLVEKTPVQIYKSIKNNTPFCEELSFNKLLEFCKYLFENNITFKIDPDFPVLHKFNKCFPDLADEYQLILQTLK